jgi:hypothetical protein
MMLVGPELGVQQQVEVGISCQYLMAGCESPLLGVKHPGWLGHWATATLKT